MKFRAGFNDTILTERLIDTLSDLIEKVEKRGGEDIEVEVTARYPNKSYIKVIWKEEL